MKGSPNRADIALLLPSLSDGGAQRVAVKLARGFLRHGLRVDMVVGSAEGRFLSELPRAARLVDLGVRRMRDSVPPLTRYLRHEQPRCLLSRLVPANIAAVSARLLSQREMKLVLAEDTHLSGQLACGTLPSHLVPTMRWFYGRADTVAAVSRGVALDLRRRLRLATDQVRVIHDPVVDEGLEQRADEASPHPWLNQTEVPAVVAVGRLVPSKDHATLLRAFAVLRSQRPARLVVFGEGSERPRLERLVVELGVQDDVALPGFCPNPLAGLKRAATYVLSSRVESLSNTLIEALACGCPVVATDCPGGPREVLEDGAYGSLVPCGDPEALGAAIHRTLDARHNRNRLRHRAAHFSFDRIMPQYLDVTGHGRVGTRRAA